MNITIGPRLDRTNTELVRLWTLFEQRCERDAAFKSFLASHTKVAGIIQEAFCPHDQHDPNFCKHRLLEATAFPHVPNGLKKFIKNDVLCGDFGRWYDLVYRIVELACLAHRCKHGGECSRLKYPVDLTLQKRGGGDGFRSLIERLREAGKQQV